MAEREVLKFMPKNIRQIGHGHTNDKIYIEDYVMTYIRQVEKTLVDKKDRLLVLIGNKEEADDVKYTFINGVVEIKDGIDICTDLLLNKNIMEITRVKEDFYDEMDILGLCVVSKGEWMKFGDDIYNCYASGMVGDVVVIRDILGQEQVFRYVNSDFKVQKCYYIYYDRNEAMQNYMLCMKDGKSIESGYIATEYIDKKCDEKVRSYSIPKNTVYTSKGIPYTKYKDIIEKKWNGKIKYAIASVLMLSLLLGGAVKVDKLEKYTKKKAEDILENSAEVMKTYDETEIKRTAKKEDKENNNYEVIEGEITVTDTPALSDVEQVVEAEENKSEENNIEENKNDENKSIENKTREVNGSNVVKHKDSYYIVKKGDALVDISRKIYGTHKKVEDIKRVNGIVDENKIIIGQKLIMP